MSRSPSPTTESTVATTYWRILRRILGLILVTAAILKAYELKTVPVAGDGLVKSAWFRLLEVEFELIYGAWLLMSWGTHWTWKLTLGLWLLFLGIVSYEIMSGADSCGCFGLIKVNPHYTAVFDLLVVAALIWVRPGQKSEGGHAWRTWQKAGFVSVIVAGFAFGTWMTVGYAKSQSEELGLILGDGTVVLEPSTWRGHRFPLLKYIDVGSQLEHGEWIVLIYRSDCEHCRRAIPNYVELAEHNRQEGKGARVAFIEMSPYALPGEEIVKAGEARVIGKLDTSHSWFASTPLALTLNDGEVKVVKDEKDLAADLSGSPAK